MLTFSQIDILLLHDISSFLTRNEVEYKILNQFGSNPILRGFPIFFMIVSIWFLNNSIEKHSRILVGLLASCIATIIAVLCQSNFTPHIRPLLDTSVHLNFVESSECQKQQFNRPGSFPSDTATLFFSLCTIIFIENRRAGAFCFVWAIITAGFIRIVMGYHYPSDIAGGFFLGVGTVSILNSIRWFKIIFARILKRLEYKEHIVHSFFFIFLADAYSSFAGLEGFYKMLNKLISVLLR